MKVNLGCGSIPVDEGWIGLDLRPPADVLADLTAPHLPFGGGTIEAVGAFQVLEHIRSEHLYSLLDEVHRVLIPGGVLVGTVPGADLDLNLAMRDPTHVSFWTRGTFAYFFADPDDELGANAFHAGRTAIWEDVEVGVMTGWCYTFRVTKPPE